MASVPASGGCHGGRFLAGLRALHEPGHRPAAARCLLLALLVSLVPLPAPSPLGAAQQVQPLELVQRHIEAFNRRDLEAMAENVAENFELYYVEAGPAEAAARGRDALRASMAEYFADFPDAEASLDGSVVDGAFVAARERVTWTADGERRTQSSLVIYEIRDGHIRRTWYFPAQR